MRCSRRAGWMAACLATACGGETVGTGSSGSGATGAASGSSDGTGERPSGGTGGSGGTVQGSTAGASATGGTGTGSGGRLPSAGMGGTAGISGGKAGGGGTSTTALVIDPEVCGHDMATLVSTASVFIGQADSLKRDLARACAGLAGTTPPATVTDGDVVALCEAGRTRLSEAYAAAGNVGIAVGDPLCAVDAAARFGCEAGCQAAAGCDCPPPNLEARCLGLFGTCAGECVGECVAAVSDGVACAGRCDGQCEGQCDGSCDVLGQGGCIGACDGNCSGFCRGSCDVQADACTATCQGECSTKLEAIGCSEALLPPSCDCETRCVAACEGLEAFGAECSPGNVSVSPSAAIDASVADAVRAHLPEIARILSAAELSADTMASLVGSVGTLTGELAAPCLAAHGADIAATVQASVQASASVSVVVQGAADVLGVVSG